MTKRQYIEHSELWMTDPYPAIRKQVEALIRATERVSEHRSVSKADLDAYDAARAALNRRVEALMLRAAYAADETAWGMRGVVTSLLNEEPDAAEGLKVNDVVRFRWEPREPYYHSDYLYHLHRMLGVVVRVHDGFYNVEFPGSAETEEHTQTRWSISVGLKLVPGFPHDKVEEYNKLVKDPKLDE